MLRSVNELLGYTILSKNKKDIGTIKDFYFDGDNWTVRYLVADTGTWLPGRKVLISLFALKRPDWAEKVFPVELTGEELENAPGIDEDKPVSRQHQAELHRYFEWPVYWTVGFEPAPIPKQDTGEETEKGSDPDLRSSREVEGYHIGAKDGEVGHVDDYIVDDSTWVIRYLVVDTRNWLPGRKVLVSPDWIEKIDYDKREVDVDLLRDMIENSPEYDPYGVLEREYETKLFDHYGRPKYWV